MESDVGREDAFPVPPAESGTFTFNNSDKARHYSAIFCSRINILVNVPIKKKKDLYFSVSPLAGSFFITAQRVKLRSHYLLHHYLVFLSLKVNTFKEDLEIGLVLSLKSIMYLSPCILLALGKQSKSYYTELTTSCQLC